jgi:flagellar hook-length control protein FliK
MKGGETMNNDLLAGILVGLPGELPVSRSKNSNNPSESGSFTLLLRDRIAEEATAGMTGEVANNRRSYSVAGTNDINPFLSARVYSSDNRARNDALLPVNRENRWNVKAIKTVSADKDAAGSVDGSASKRRDAENAAKDKITESQQSASARASFAKAREDAATEDNAATAASDRRETAASERNEAVVSEIDEANVLETVAALAAAIEEASLSSDEAAIVNADALSEAAAEKSENAQVNADAENKLAVTNSQQTLTTQIARIEELLGAFSPEVKAAMIETLQQLSPEDLEIAAESSAEFCQKLSELVSEMPDSAEKDKLLGMLESAEFLQMMQALSAQNSNSASSDPTGLTADKAAENMVATSDKATAAQSATATIDAQQSADSNAAMKSETGDDEISTKEQDQAERRETAKNTSDKNVDTQKKTVTLEQEGGKESLREEFKLASKTGHPTTAAPAVTPEQAKTAIEEAAKKFFTLFNEKAAGGERAATAETYSPEAIKRHSGMSNNSAGNGGNGFSSHTGTPASSMSAARPATPVPAANQIFSQMLEKAEYLKTQNGSKVLNMEFDPGELGKLEMELTSRDGTVSARISAESALAKAQLEELAPQIKEQLLNQGVNLTEITVDISSRNPDESNRDQMSGGKGKSSRIQAAEKEAAEAIIRKNILPNLRRAALNIKAVDLTV